ncbi:helix-turn-helix domain-containing protein [Melghirimyces algeriensis]|uniref:helix-turn-helix domain-containing protein n=1 Tax=Melghirimyces algeriensis TaxID=910412 RepID=UPI002483265C|nr:helix-turn-helix transcriptional regulator [Melghirimyces algeriensis]
MPNTSAKYEKSKREPDYVTLKKIADYFDVSVDYILGHKVSNIEAEEKFDLKEFLEKNETAHWGGVPLNDELREYFSDLLETVIKREEAKKNQGQTLD